MQDVLSYARWSCYSIFTGSTLHRSATNRVGDAMLDRPIGRGGPWILLIQKASAMTDDAKSQTTTSAWVSPVDADSLGTGGIERQLRHGGTRAIGDLTTFNPGNGAWIEDIT